MLQEMVRRMHIPCCHPVGLSKRMLTSAVYLAGKKKREQCPECHAEASDHDLARTMEMVFLCKKCKKAFRKDMEVFEESDEYCPHCDNHFVRPSPFSLFRYQHFRHVESSC